MISERDYAETAYDSKKRNIAPPDPALWKDRVERWYRSHPLPQGVHCGDFRFEIDKSMARDLKEGKTQDLLTQEQMQVGSLKNPLVVMATIRFLALVLSFIGLFVFFIAKEDPFTIADWESYIFFLIGITIYITCFFLMKVVPNKNNITFNRRTGMVTIPQLGRKPDVILPFEECDGYYYCPQNPVGQQYKLYIGHRFSDKGTDTLREWTRPWSVYYEWEFIQQYMDVSKPLPDIPELEPYRHLDPTTAEHDRKTSRPPHYWRDMDLDQVAWEQKKGIEVAKNFHWGMSREQALTSGWQPIVVREERPSPENFVAIDKRGDFEEM